MGCAISSLQLRRVPIASKISKGSVHDSAPDPNRCPRRSHPLRHSPDQAWPWRPSRAARRRHCERQRRSVLGGWRRVEGSPIGPHRRAHANVRCHREPQRASPQGHARAVPAHWLVEIPLPPAAADPRWRYIAAARRALSAATRCALSAATRCALNAAAFHRTAASSQHPSSASGQSLRAAESAF